MTGSLVKINQVQTGDSFIKSYINKYLKDQIVMQLIDKSDDEIYQYLIQ